jgi:hypothetical protein
MRLFERVCLEFSTIQTLIYMNITRRKGSFCVK